MSNNRGHHRVMPTITSMMIATYSITSLIGLLWLGIAFLGVDSLFWLISSWSQLSIRKGQDLKLIQEGIRGTSPAHFLCRHTGPGRLADMVGTGLPGLRLRFGAHLLV